MSSQVIRHTVYRVGAFQIVAKPYCFQNPVRDYSSVKMHNRHLFRHPVWDATIIPKGITQQGNTLTFATPERAFLDMVYLNGEMYFDYLRPMDREKIEQILPIYKSKIFKKRAIKLLENDRFR